MKTTSLLMAAALMVSAFAPVARAADEEPSKTELENLEKRAEALGQIATAAQLASYGRGELIETPQMKGVKNPEALVAAGGILLRVHNLTEGKMGSLDGEVKDDKGAVVTEKLKSKSLAEEADDLFKEAEGIVLINKGDSKALAALIAKAKADAVVKGAIGGPKWAVRILPSGGAFHIFTVTMAPKSPASITVESTSKLKVEMFGEGGKQIYSSGARTVHSHSWHTGRDPSGKNITVKIYNGSGPPAKYRISTN